MCKLKKIFMCLFEILNVIFACSAILVGFFLVLGFFFNFEFIHPYIFLLLLLFVGLSSSILYLCIKCEII